MIPQGFSTSLGYIGAQYTSWLKLGILVGLLQKSNYPLPFSKL